MNKMSSKEKRTDFQPILLGTDFNCYGMADRKSVV